MLQMFSAIHPHSVVCPTVSVCDTIVFIHFIHSYGITLHTLVKVCMYTDTHLRSYFFYFFKVLSVTQITTDKGQTSLQIYSSLLCYTAKMPGAVNIEILYPYPCELSHTFTSCSCKLHLSLVLRGI